MGQEKRKIKKVVNKYVRNLKDKKILETILSHLIGKYIQRNN